MDDVNVTGGLQELSYAFSLEAFIFITSLMDGWKMEPPPPLGLKELTAASMLAIVLLRNKSHLSRVTTEYREHRMNSAQQVSGFL